MATHRLAVQESATNKSLQVQGRSDSVLRSQSHEYGNILLRSCWNSTQWTRVPLWAFAPGLPFPILLRHGRLWAEPYFQNKDRKQIRYFCIHHRQTHSKETKISLDECVCVCGCVLNIVQLLSLPHVKIIFLIFLVHWIPIPEQTTVL